MSVQTAKIIDLEERRRARQGRDAWAGYDAASPVAPVVAMTWMPIWFFPVFFTGSSNTFG